MKNKKITIVTVEYIRPGKMILLHGKNVNIPVSHPCYSGVYQDESKN